jgi:acetyltransferase EpsM
MNASTHIVILGAGGDALVVAEGVRQAAEAGQPLALAGFLDDNSVGQSIDGVPVLGRLDAWPALDPDVRFVPAIHKIKQMHARMRRLRELDIPAHRWRSVVHPSASIARSAIIEEGVFLAANVVVQPHAAVGRFASIRAGASLGHDAVCGAGAYMGPSSTLCGKAQLLEGAHLGPNAVVIDGVVVEPYAVVGAGTVATKRIPSFEVHLGVPARRIGGVLRP